MKITLSPKTDFSNEEITEVLKELRSPFEKAFNSENDSVDYFLEIIDDQHISEFFSDVRVIDSNGTKVTIVYFGDGTFEKAVCHKDDTYSLEQGISICVTKKILSELTVLNGTTAYNKLIRKALKVMKNNRKAEEKAKQESAAEELRRKKVAEKRQKRLAKIVERKRKEQIEIQEEAYLRAMKKYNLCFGDED